MLKTIEVKQLVRAVLAELPQPVTENVIEDVFVRIEQTPKWREEYDRLVDLLGKDVVNTWGGSWIAQALGKSGTRQVASQRATLIGSYSILDADARVPAKKPKEADALQMMSDHYQAHKADLPPDIRQYREDIVELIMNGMSPEQAFTVARRAV